MRSKWKNAILPAAILILALVLLPGCMQEAGDDGGGGGDGNNNSDYTSLTGAWDYAGRFDNSDGSYEEHAGTATFTEQNGILKISLNGTWRNSNGGAGAGEFSFQEGQIDTELQKVEFPETLISLNGGACHGLLAATGRWTDYRQFSLTGEIDALDCATFYSSDLEMGFLR